MKQVRDRYGGSALKLVESSKKGSVEWEEGIKKIIINVEWIYRIGMVRMCFVEYRSAMEADLKKYEIKRMEGINSVQFAGSDKAENKPVVVNPYQ